MSVRLMSLAALVFTTPALAQAPCEAPESAALIEELPGDWQLHLGAGTRTEPGNPAAPLAAVEAPVVASVTSSGNGVVLSAEEFGDLALFFAAPGQDAPLGVAMSDGSRVFTDPVLTGWCDPSQLPRLIGGGAAKDAELALDLFAFTPELYSGSMTYRQGETVWVRVVTLDREDG